jgi:hypothetical protein
MSNLAADVCDNYPESENIRGFLGGLLQNICDGLACDRLPKTFREAVHAMLSVEAASYLDAGNEPAVPRAKPVHVV